MTPKDRAVEIAMRFDKEGETDNAIKCALICVDEILNIYQLDEYAFWKEVKQELLKL